MRVYSRLLLGLASVSVGLASVPVVLIASEARAEAPKIKELRTQRVGEGTYFHVRFEKPADLQMPKLTPGPHSEAQRRQLAWLPALVSQDAKAHDVYLRLDVPHFRPRVQFQANGNTLPAVDGLEFVGKLTDSGDARFLLIYPNGDMPAGTERNGLGKLVRRATWMETPVTLDFDEAKKLPALDRKTGPVVAQSEVEALWAEGQSGRFAILEAIVPDFGFYGFACAATGRKYGVPDAVLSAQKPYERERVSRQLYEMTTGSAAITASLGTQRLLDTSRQDRGKRTVDVRKVPGIDIAEHPWEKMMAGKKPADEPLAQLTPHDNYYFHFKDIRKLIEFMEVLDQWGTNVIRGYEATSADYQLKERYERQLCLRAGPLAKQFGPTVVRGVAVTGNDPFLREGSDVTFLFQVESRMLFHAAVEPFLQEAKKEFGDRLKQTREEHQGVAIESFVTPLREVSLHRASFGEFVLYSNSAVGLRRALDAYRGKAKRLGDSLDFQYMRTVFNLRDAEEDGFGFLSDAFIRQLVGPASKIKEKRRLEALTSLQMATNGALFTAWETGELPKDHAELLAASALRQEDLWTPEGAGVKWDAQERVAVSEAYNTIHFLTPLVELPIDYVTPIEEEEYRKFRQQYVQLWRRFFDPVGIRVSLTEKRLRLEVYILPLINNAEYNSLRAHTGDGTAKFNLAELSPRSLLQFMGHISPRSFGPNGGNAWFMLRLDDSPQLEKLLQLWMHRELHGVKDVPIDEGLALATQLPITAAVGGNGWIVDQIKSLLPYLEGGEGVTKGENRYRGVTVYWIRFAADSSVVKFLQGASGAKQPLTPTIYHATIENGVYVGFSEDAIRDLIDQSVARREGKGSAKEELIDVNTSLYLSPSAAYKSKEAFSAYLEWESHKRAWPNNAILYALHRCRLIGGRPGQTITKDAAMKFLGFVPVSPDGAAYTFEPRTDEASNARHGSLRHPSLHSKLFESSPVRGLAEQVKSLRVDLRFREDGIHTILTIDRQ